MPAAKPNDIDPVGPHYSMPPEPKRWPAIGLALGVHAALIAFLVIGVSWQSNTPVAVEAEIWDMQTQTAAPAPAPAPEPEPEPEPETPPPAPTPRAVEPPPPPVEQPAPPKQPDIALEREKKRQEDLKRKEEARLERQREEERAQREEQKRIEQQKRDDDKKAKALADKKERELEAKKEKELADKQAREDAAKKEAEQKKKDDAEKKKKAEADKKKQDAADQKKRDAARAEEMRRITGAAGSGSPTSTGSAAQSTAPRLDKGYAAAITAKVKGNTSYAGDLDEPGNPTVTFRVEQLPTGDIISVRKIKSSGVPAFDEAVEKGIRKSEPLPKKKDGTVERTLEINFRMKDMQ